MHVAVIGGGVIGALSAYYLEQAGARVTLLEREADLAPGTSGMNGSQLSYSYVSPLGSPAIYGLLRKVVTGGMEDVRVFNWLDPKLVHWGVRLLQQSSKDRYKANQDALLALSLESCDLMAKFRTKHSVDFDYAENGKLHLYVSQEQVETARAFAATLEKHGIHQEILDPAQCIAREPALQERSGPLAGGMFSPADAVGDCGMFTRGLKGIYGSGVTCRTGVAVRKIHAPGGKFESIETDTGERIGADAVLVCAGAESASLLRGMGAGVTMYPVKGYSASFDNKDIGLKANVTDHARRVVFAPHGGKIKMAGFMHFAGLDPAVHDSTRAALLKLARDVFPAAKLAEDAPIAAGFRPYTPSSTPVTGETRTKGVFVNIGHAMLGWTLAHATCRRAADSILN